MTNEAQAEAIYAGDNALPRRGALRNIVAASRPTARRNSTRLPLAFTAKLEGELGELIEARVMNVSRSGFMAKVARKVEVGSAVSLITASGRKLPAVVRWTKEDCMGFQLAAELTWHEVLRLPRHKRSRPRPLRKSEVPARKPARLDVPRIAKAELPAPAIQDRVPPALMLTAMAAIAAAWALSPTDVGPSQHGPAGQPSAGALQATG